MRKQIGDKFSISILVWGFLLAMALAPRCEADGELRSEDGADAAPVPPKSPESDAALEAGATEPSI